MLALELVGEVLRGEVPQDVHRFDSYQHHQRYDDRVITYLSQLIMADRELLESIIDQAEQN